VWEVPVLTEHTRERLLQHNPDVQFIKWGNIYRFKIKPLNDNELWACPALGENGCVLGDDKPFECDIWPFRIMEIGDERFICVSPLCTAVTALPLSELLAFLKKDLAAKIFTYADYYPDIIRPFDYCYIPLLADAKI
jgi:hypothetical protein